MVIAVAAALPAPNSDGEKIATPAITTSQQIRRATAFDRFIFENLLFDPSPAFDEATADCPVMRSGRIEYGAEVAAIVLTSALLVKKETRNFMFVLGVPSHA